MFSNKKTMIITGLLAAGLFLIMSAVASADATIDNISLKKQGSFTELTIYPSGHVDYEHQIVEPGAGKPYRVVIDLKGSIHKLPHYNFNDLPGETVTCIRTSQFSVNPEKIVRVVLDIKGQVTYKVRQSDGNITLVMATPNDREFPFWCAQPLSESEKMQLALGGSVSPDSDEPTAGKKEIDEETPGPVLVSTAVSDNREKSPKIPPAVLKPKSVTESETEVVKQPKSTPLPLTAAEKMEANELSKATVRQEVTEPQVEHSKMATAVFSMIPEFAEDDNQVSQDEEPVSKPEPVTEKKQAKPTEKFTDSAMKLPLPEADRLTDSSARDALPGAPRMTPPTKDDDSSEKEKFQKNPERPTKTTGTLADRFPKRKVIEYNSWGKRDPFAQLVDKSMAGYTPGEPPNVETLRLVGVLRSIDGSSALLEDYEGYGYILKDGDEVRNGYVVQIGDDKVIFQIKEYGWSRTVALRLETE